MAVAACLLSALPGGAARAADSGFPMPAESLSDRATTAAGRICDFLHEQIVDPTRRAADAAMASPVFAQAYRQFTETAQSVATTVNDNAVQPLGRAATDLLNSPHAEQARAFAGSVFDSVTAGVQRYVVDPLGDLLSSPPGKGTALDPRSRGDDEALPPVPTPVAAVQALSDPFEPVNRRIFAFNSGLRSHLLDPVVAYYRDEAPPAVQESLQNFFSNLREPITIASSLLEGDVSDAGNATARFGINTTVGVVGLYDPATGYGFPRRKHNLEETLCLYRLPSGPYVVLPLYGPATVRDAVGRLATIAAYFEAMGFGVYVPYRLGDAVAQSVAPRKPGGLADQLSPDPYLTQKTLYLAERSAGCGRYLRNGSDTLSP
jgi:ABC-type transporter lipoprotein component MlaA